MRTNAVPAAAPSPMALYATGLAGRSALRARLSDGRRLRLDVERWLGGTDAADESVLDRAAGPTLDVGCGPGRLVVGAAGRGLYALGLDVSPDAVALARRRGARVIEACVFAGAPGAGEWETVLLLDGNIGIGGDAVALLSQVRALLAPGGRVLVEVEPAGIPCGRLTVRLEAGDERSSWFTWARVGADGIAPVAAQAGLAVAEAWEVASRCFVRLEAAA